MLLCGILKTCSFICNKLAHIYGTEVRLHLRLIYINTLKWELVTLLVAYGRSLTRNKSISLFTHMYLHVSCFNVHIPRNVVSILEGPSRTDCDAQIGMWWPMLRCDLDRIAIVGTL